MCLQDGGIRRSETESRDVKLTQWEQLIQGFPQDKIIAVYSVFIAGHMALSGLIFSIF